MSKSKSSRNTGIQDDVQSVGTSEPQIKGPGLIDKQRRRSLKAIGAGMVAPFGMLSGGSAVLALDRDVADGATRKPAGQTLQTQEHQLELHLYASRSVQEDSLLIRNRMDTPLLVRNIKPSLIVYRGRYIDLRTLTEEAPLSLAAGHTVSFRVFSQPLYGQAWSQSQATLRAESGMPALPEGSSYALPDDSSYLWAEDSINVITDDTVLVSVAAVVENENALLHTKPKQSVARKVQLS